MKARARAAGLGLCLLSACAADVVTVGAWAGEAKPDPGPTLDASAGSTSDAAAGPRSDATSEPPSDAATRPPMEPAGTYIEAEQGELSAGFEVEADAQGSGGRVLKAVARASSQLMPGDARARYLLDVRKPGDYVLWGRIQGPDERQNRFWFQVDGGTWYLWRMSTGEAWYWDDLHDNTSYRKPVTFALTQGVHELLLANATEGVRLDRLYFTAAGDMPPGNDTPCEPPDTVELAGKCIPSCGSLKGTACGAMACDGIPLLEAYDCDVCCKP